MENDNDNDEKQVVTVAQVQELLRLIDEACAAHAEYQHIWNGNIITSIKPYKEAFEDARNKYEELAFKLGIDPYNYTFSWTI